MGQLRAQWGPRLCSLVPLAVWHRLLSVDLLIPYYHVISDDDLEHISGLYQFRNTEQFEQDLETLLRSYTPISLTDVIRCLDGAQRLPNRCFLLTFDDGFREMHQIVAPILLSKGIPAVFFLTSSSVGNFRLCYPAKKSLLIRRLASLCNSSSREEVSRRLASAGIETFHLLSSIRNVSYRQRGILDDLAPVLGCDFADYAATVQPYLTVEQATDLTRQGFDIGAHSIDHPPFSELTIEEQLAQAKGSLHSLSQLLQYECRAFAFPYEDTAVSPDFFTAAFADGSLRVSFGTGGVMPHYFPRNLERFSMERTELSARQIVARELGRAAVLRVKGSVARGQRCGRGGA